MKSFNKFILVLSMLLPILFSGNGNLFSMSSDSNESEDYSTKLRLTSSLHQECEKSNPDFQKIVSLVNSGACVNFLEDPDDSNFEGDFLLFNNLNPFYIDTNKSCLSLLLENGVPSLEVLELLINNGADVNNVEFGEKTTALHIFLLNHQYWDENVHKVIDFLIKQGIDINAKNYDENTCLYSLCESRFDGNLEKIKILIENGADVNLPNNRRGGRTPINCACSVFFPSLDILKCLVEGGADVNSVDSDGISALHSLCRGVIPDLDQIRFLTISGCKVNVQDREGFTPIHRIFDDNYSVEQVSFDKKYGRITRFSQGGSRSCYFPTAKKIQLIEFLLEFGADYNIVNNDGHAPLDLAEEEELCQFIFRWESIQRDFQSLFENTEFTDSQIKGVNYHDLIFNARLGSKKKGLAAKEVLVKFEQDVVRAFIKWIYGQYLDKNEQNLANSIFQELGIEVNTLNSGVLGLRQMLKTLWLNEDEFPKDFIIKVPVQILENQEEEVIEEIKVHKLVLIARSQLFRGMFSCTGFGETNYISDYTRNSSDIIRTILEFFYTDKLCEQKIDLEVLKKGIFNELSEYFQLDENCFIYRELDRIKSLLPELFESEENDSEESQERVKTKRKLV